MYKVTKFPQGTFSWADCGTSDWAAGKEFYADLMGWETEDTPMGEGQFYTFFKQDGERVGAISQLSPEMLEQGMPSAWSNYVTVDDVDAMVNKVKELGGTVFSEPFDVFEDGRMAVVGDPTGGALCLWQPKGSIGAGLVNTTGAMLWNELMTREPEKVKDFYGKLLGWEYQKDENQDGYYMIVNNGRMNGAIMDMGDEMPDGVPSTWNVYYNVADLDAALEVVKKHGGAVHVNAEAENVGRFALINDPQGAMLYLMQAKFIEEWEEN